MGFYFSYGVTLRDFNFPVNFQLYQLFLSLTMFIKKEELINTVAYLVRSCEMLVPSLINFLDARDCSHSGSTRPWDLKTWVQAFLLYNHYIIQSQLESKQIYREKNYCFALLLKVLFIYLSSVNTVF